MRLLPKLRASATNKIKHLLVNEALGNEGLFVCDEVCAVTEAAKRGCDRWALVEVLAGHVDLLKQIVTDSSAAVADFVCLTSIAYFGTHFSRSNCLELLQRYSDLAVGPNKTLFASSSATTGVAFTCAPRR
ncbi:hypothetical protein [uncultured Hydrogenophaga sp.]|uniref:hypothetical protein n=1 Tax=uncultured Hydrogenophaga sp. TaxID=199683 RepID=UPI00258F5941|nr:hypothetical protein [uncultured Hydrogenophaga sp.]